MAIALTCRGAIAFVIEYTVKNTVAAGTLSKRAIFHSLSR